MQESPFKIYNASAGSGKTYALSKAYLKIVLSAPHSFKRILAITFTNKAVNEMKSRILENLFAFGKVENLEDASPLFLELMQDLHLSMESLKDLSKLRLKEILHNYAFFDISTIDKFTHRVIRTFARDLKIPQNFEVVLDMDLLLTEAVSRVLSKAGEDQELTKILMDFAMEKIDDDKSWDIGYDLLKIGKLLLDENNVNHIQVFCEKQLSDFVQLQKHVLNSINYSRQLITNVANSALQLIDSNSLEFKDFKGSYFPKFMLQISLGNFDIDFESNWKKNFDNEKPYNKSTRDYAKSIIDNLHPEFISQMKIVKNESSKLNLLQNIYKNLVPLTLLNTIENELKQIQLEKDQLSISEFNTIISKEIKNQPAPFIYERLGEKYRHYFIDEFQDTSEMQWNNLNPLIANALEGSDEQGRTGSLFLVGDAKQAIYRWRGGKAEQFLNLATQKSNPFSVASSTHLLPRNYRSHDRIIEFNNSFFQSISALLENLFYRDFFEKGNKQQTNNQAGGYVNLSFLEEEEDGSYALKTIEAIEKSLKNGYGYGDICIIVRKKKHAVALTDYLMNGGIPVISSDSLLLSSSPKVQFLVSLIKFMLMPDDKETNYRILDFLSGTTKDSHDFILPHLNNPYELLRTQYNFDSKKYQGQSLLDAMEYAIKVFDLAPNSDAHVLAFMDFVFEMEQNNGTDAQSFLNNWDLKSDKLSISTPENSAAVQVMTIHKSKGLEFPVVIFPYANTKIYEEIDPKLWIPVDPDSYLGFEELLISKKQEVRNYGETQASIFDREHEKLQLDAYNLLYVALTRAVSCLYIITCKDLKKDGSYKPDYYSGLFIHYLISEGIWQQDVLEYAFGVVPYHAKQPINNTEPDIPYIYTHKDRKAFKIHTKAGMLWDTDRGAAIDQGNVFHHILASVNFEEDLPKALDQAIKKGFLSQSDYLKVDDTLTKVVQHPDLRKFYSKNATPLNEKELLLSNGSTLRPDRVVIEDRKVHIIDYKTGKKSPKYKEQLESYANAFLEMGYEVENKIIAYINEDIIVEYI